MNELQLLCLALGLSTLAGLRLYLTVFLTSLALNQGWLALDPAYSSLDVLGSNGVLIASGVLLVLEFMADKVAGFDSVWDGIHTAIRPVGATILALQVLGDWPPEAKIIAGLCAGTVALTVHAAKAGSRLIVNTSPEPVSNILASAAEEGVVVILFALLLKHPYLAALLCIGMIAFSVWATPRAWRMAKATFWLFWQKLTRAPRPATRLELPRHLSSDHDMLVSGVLGDGKMTVAWAVETLSSRPRGVRGLDSNRFGVLVASHERPDTVAFLARKLFRRAVVKISIEGCQVAHECAFLSENLAVYHRQTRQRAVFRFPRAEAAIVARLADDLRARIQQLEGPAEPAEPAELEPAPRFALDNAGVN